MVRGSAEQLEQCGADIQRVFGGLDAKAARESYGQLAVWFGRLPGHPASRQPRRVFVSAGVAACLAPLFGPPRGDRRCAHLDKPALTVFETPAGTPYHYDLFGGRDVGHTLMLGATGAGKSFTLNCLRDDQERRRLAAARRAGPGTPVRPARPDPRPRRQLPRPDAVPRGRLPRSLPGEGRHSPSSVRPGADGADGPVSFCLGAAAAADRRLGGVERRPVGGAGAHQGPVRAGPGASLAREPRPLAAGADVAGAVALARLGGLAQRCSWRRSR